MRCVWLLVCLVLAGCGAGPSPTPSSAQGPEQGWERLPTPPLSPRTGPVAAWVDHRAVFVGGDTGEPCPANADCARSTTFARDGAAYDLQSRTWTRIAPSPVPVADLAPHAVAGGRLYLVTDRALLGYDPGSDTWARLRPPTRLERMSPVADGRRLLLVSGSDEAGVRADLTLDTRTGRWSRLPRDPLGRSFDRTITPTPYGLVLTARSIDRDNQPADPALVRAALLPPDAREWTRLPDGDLLGGGRWVWTGRRVLDATLGGADGGQVNGYGRTIPFGGTLDPRTRRWSPLRNPPEAIEPRWAVDAAGSPVTAAGGWLFDDRRDSWTRLDRPAGAPEQPGPAVWAGDTMIVFGGTGRPRPAGDASSSNQAWALTVP